MIKLRKPMDAVQAGKHAQRLLAEHEQRKKPNSTQSDAVAFRQIKQSVNTPDLAEAILESFELVERLDEHRHK